jgi:hypothetical protein
MIVLFCLLQNDLVTQLNEKTELQNQLQSEVERFKSVLADTVSNPRSQWILCKQRINGFMPQMFTNSVLLTSFDKYSNANG